MSFLAAYIYDKVMADTEAACLMQWRQQLLTIASGRVLEIGAGTGANLDFYPNTVSELIMIEPDDNMRVQLLNKLKAKQGSGLNIKVLAGSAERIDAPDNSQDFVVSTLVCCSVANLNGSLLEIKRVLKPGGKLIFMEHVAAKAGTGRRTWQNILNPVWRKIAGNCHLNRDTEQAILDAGFAMDELIKESMRKAIPLVRPTIRGYASKV